MRIPSMIQIESSTACTGKCKFCPVGKGLKRQGGSMTDDLFNKIILDANSLQIKRILLFLNGEPFVFNRLFDWLDILRNHKMVTNIFTNASHLTKEKSDKLISYADVVEDIVFSLSGKDTVTHNQIMGLDHDKVKENVSYFSKVNKGTIKTSAHMPLFSATSQWVKEWKKIWGPIVGSANTTQMFNWAGDINDPMLSGGVRKPCLRLDQMTILWNGKVNLCCMDAEGQVILGDLNTQSIAEVFNGPVASYYYETHKNNKWEDLDLCRKCNLNIY